MGSVSEGGGHRSPGVLDVDPASSRVVADLRHPHLTAMKSVSDERGVEPELAAGCSLADLKQAAELPLRISLRILLDVLSGIAAIHHAKVDGKPIGFVHGEVAPTNIIVGRDGVARLVPLSRGQGANDSNLVGYQAPELLLGDAVDQRADVFSAGVLLWEAMSGTRLFRDMPAEEIVIQLIGGKVLPPPAPREAPWAADLSEVAMRAIDVDPTQRWPHVGALGSTIENIAHIYVALPAELAQFVSRTMGGGSRASFSDEVTAKRRILSDGPTMPPPESLAAVSTQVLPQLAPAIVTPLPPAPFEPASVPQHVVALHTSPAYLSESFGAPLPVQGMRPRRRWIIVAGVLAASVVVALITAHKILRTESAPAAVTVLPGPVLARPPEAIGTAREAPPPLPLATAALPAAVPSAASPEAAPSEAAPPPASTQVKAAPASAHAPVKPALPSVAAPPAARPAPTPVPPTQKPKPAADQFGI